MHIVRLAALIAIVGMMGLAQADKKYEAPDESAFTLDLEKATGHTYFIKCQTRSLLSCTVPEVWEQTNGYPGLQTAPLTIQNARFSMDYELLS